ncbi:MAG: hypothetical protein E4G92_02285 [Bacteroidia bacterium]|nr:MAG: hypothetical protein E4G92_02285 [Bacteroidia bacterium]
MIVEAGEGMPDSISNSERRRRVVGIVGDLSREISSWPEVASVQSFTDQLDFERRFSVPGFRVTIFPRSKNPFVSKDQNCYRINVKIKDSRDIWKVNSMLSTGFSPYEPVFKCGVYSDFLFFHYISSRVTSSILRSLLLSAVLIFLLIFLLTRSVRITAAAILANMIPIGFLILILAGFRIDLNITTSITLVVCLGLIVDDTIHILYRSVLLKIPLDELSFGVLNTSIILTVGFSLFLLSQSKQIQLFGILNAIVFMIAVISDLAVLSWLLNKHNLDKPDSEDCNYK